MLTYRNSQRLYTSYRHDWIYTIYMYWVYTCTCPSTATVCTRGLTLVLTHPHNGQDEVEVFKERRIHGAGGFHLDTGLLPRLHPV